MLYLRSSARLAGRARPQQQRQQPFTRVQLGSRRGIRCRAAADGSGGSESAPEPVQQQQQPGQPQSPQQQQQQQRQPPRSAVPNLKQQRSFSAFTTEEQWRELDKEINKYPSQRTFTAIGSGGEEFASAMVAAVESVVGGVHMECIAQTPSSGNKYLSVRIGPVWVKNADQVVQVFSNMRKDPRLKWYM